MHTAQNRWRLVSGGSDGLNTGCAGMMGIGAGMVVNHGTVDISS